MFWHQLNMAQFFPYHRYGDLSILLFTVDKLSECATTPSFIVSNDLTYPVSMLPAYFLNIIFDLSFLSYLLIHFGVSKGPLYNCCYLGFWNMFLRYISLVFCSSTITLKVNRNNTISLFVITIPCLHIL